MVALDAEFRCCGIYVSLLFLISSIHTGTVHTHTDTHTNYSLYASMHATAIINGTKIVLVPTNENYIFLTQTHTRTLTEIHTDTNTH